MSELWNRLHAAEAKLDAKVAECESAVDAVMLEDCHHGFIRASCVICNRTAGYRRHWRLRRRTAAWGAMVMCRKHFPWRIKGR